MGVILVLRSSDSYLRLLRKSVWVLWCLGKRPRSKSDGTRPFLVEEFVVSSRLRFGSFWEFLGNWLDFTTLSMEGRVLALTGRGRFGNKVFVS